MPSPNIHLYFLALLGGLTFCVPVMANAGAHAGSTWQISNRVVIEHGVLSIDHSKNVKQITLAQAQGGFKADLGVGLFQNRLKTELSFNETSLPGKRLAMTTRIVTAPVIYIASDLPKDSCAFKLVLDHEMKHHDYDLEVLRSMPDEVRQFSQDIFDTAGIERTGSLNQERARNRFFQQFNYVYQALGQMRHPFIDSPESYRDLSGQCNGELGRLLAGKPNQANSPRPAAAKVAK
jgi:hypothetical protein